MKKLSIILIIVIATVIVALAAKRSDQKSFTKAPGVKVAASFYPLAEFAKQVGGENIEVINIVPPGTEPHDFEPTPQDMAKVYAAQIFVYNGGGLAPWAEKIAPELEKKGVSVINMTRHFNLLAFDPHIWLDPALAKKEVELIRDGLKEIDAENSSVYENNAKNYLAALSQLDKKYREGLASCAIRDAVASHAAFDYLAKRYNLNIVNIAGLSPEEEPSPKKIAEIAQSARGKKIKYIFFETLVSPKLAQTIAKEIGAQTLVFNPLEGLTDEELAAGENYISIMEENLTNLRLALACQ